MWNQIACNTHYDDYLKDREAKRLYRSLRGIKSIVDASCPRKVPHLKKRSKKAQLKDDRQEEINYSNQILMEKMFNIDSRILQARSASRRNSQRSLNKNNRSRQNFRINEENQKLLERLQRANPVLSIQKWEQDERQWQSLRNNIKKKGKRYGRCDSSSISDRDVVMNILKRRRSRPSTALSSDIIKNSEAYER